MTLIDVLGRSEGSFRQLGLKAGPTTSGVTYETTITTTIAGRNTIIQQFCQVTVTFVSQTKWQT